MHLVIPAQLNWCANYCLCPGIEPTTFFLWGQLLCHRAAPTIFQMSWIERNIFLLKVTYQKFILPMLPRTMCRSGLWVKAKKSYRRKKKNNNFFCWVHASLHRPIVMSHSKTFPIDTCLPMSFAVSLPELGVNNMGISCSTFWFSICTWGKKQQHQ